MRSTSKGDVPARYDAIYASPEFDVLDVRYPFKESTAAGSEHSAVWVHLRLRENASPPPAGKDYQPRGEARREQKRIGGVRRPAAT